jgi:hypothetical protein
MLCTVFIFVSGDCSIDICIFVFVLLFVFCLVLYCVFVLLSVCLSSEKFHVRLFCTTQFMDLRNDVMCMYVCMYVCKWKR